MDAQDIIRRFCHLQSEVAAKIDCGAIDCFCGESGYWDVEGYNGSEKKGYRNEGIAIAFIENAVRMALK